MSSRLTEKTPPNPPLSGAVTEIYRTTPEAILEIQMFLPSGKVGPKPGIVFFYGGGWKDGKISQFLSQAQQCAARGLAAFLVNYRVKNRHGTSPLAAVEDARAAMRYLKTHAARLGINPQRMVAAGGSAGGHLAFCTALAETVNAEEDDLTVDPRPCLIVGFNPVCDTSPDGFGHDFFPQGTARQASPVHLVTTAPPPALILHGTDDKIVPIAQARALTEAILRAGGKCTLIEYPGRVHGFFNHSPDLEVTFEELDRFLVEAGLLA